MDHKDIAAKGGRSTLKRYGVGHFSKIGKISAKLKLEKYGTEYFKKISILGVEARRKKAGKSLSQKVVEIITSI